MALIDRILTIIVTATITSAVWIVAGGSLIENASSVSQRERTRPAEAAPSPNAATADRGAEPDTEGSDTPAGTALDSSVTSVPDARSGRELVVPVLNVRPSELTDTFSDSRADGSRLHEAIDIMAPKGTSVVAAGPGEIEKLFESDAGGLTIYVRSPDRRTIHYYAHLDRPEKLNSITLEMATELNNAVKDSANDESVKCLAKPKSWVNRSMQLSSCKAMPILNFLGKYCFP